MYCIALLQGMIFYGPVATLYRQAVGVSVFQITIIESISLALMIFLELPWGIIADRVGYKKVMIFCSFLYLISKLVFWKANGFGGFLAERILLSIVSSGLSGVDVSILYLSTSKKNSQKVFGIYYNLSTIGLIFAAGIYSLFLGANLRLAGFMTVISYGMAAILALFLVEVKLEVKSEDERKNNTVKNFVLNLTTLLRNKYFLLFLISVALLNETHQTITVFLNQLQYVKCGISNQGIGWIYIVVTLVGLLGGFSDRVTKKMGERAFAKAMFLIMIACCFVLSFTSKKSLSIVGILLIRVCYSLFQPLQMNLQNKQVNTANRATELSVNAVIIDAVAIGTNVLFGRFADLNLSYAMLLGCAFCLLGLILFLLWEKQTRCRWKNSV